VDVGGLWTILDAFEVEARSFRPFSAAARKIIAEQPRGAPGEFRLQCHVWRTSFADWRRAAVALGRCCQAVDTFGSCNDLRRAFSTGMGEVLNIEESIIGPSPGHSARTRMGVTLAMNLASASPGARCNGRLGDVVNDSVREQADSKVVTLAAARARG